MGAPTTKHLSLIALLATLALLPACHSSSSSSGDDDTDTGADSDSDTDTDTDSDCDCPLGGLASLIDGGQHFACAMSEEGMAACWGRDDRGELGDGEEVSSETISIVVGLPEDAYHLDSGDAHSCVMTTSSDVAKGAEALYCWGRIVNGDPGWEVFESAHLMEGFEHGVIAHAAGDGMQCAVTTPGGVRCWGANGAGQLGNGLLQDSTSPVDVVGLDAAVVAIGAGQAHTCASLETGAMMCWGDNWAGQLGNGETDNFSAVPVAVVGFDEEVVKIDAGYAHTCVLTKSGKIMCWGANSAGQLGNGEIGEGLISPVPVEVVGIGAEVEDINVGGNHACLLTVDGAMKCWGSNGFASHQFGQLGNGELEDSPVPVDVVGLSSGVIAIGVGELHSCAIVESGGIKCWGHNIESDDLDSDDPGNSSVPVDVEGFGC